MAFTIPDTPNGALGFALFAFVLAFVSASLIGLALAAFPLLNRLGSGARKGAHRAQREDAEIVPGEHIAAISAALAAVLGSHRIVRIEPAYHGSVWRAESRAAQHGSHAVSHPGASQRQPDNHTGNSHGTEIQNNSRRPAV
jgi:hypothetical protein